MTTRPSESHRLAPVPDRLRRRPLEPRYAERVLVAERFAAIDRVTRNDELADLRDQLAFDLEERAA
jgi:hypothetical protein